MPRTNFNELLEAGVHFGHLRRKWNPAMAPYIFMERNGIHIIDLHKTVVKLEEAANALKQIAKSGRKILFVATKKQAKDIVAESIKPTNMPYVTERWPGGMLTNFPTIRRAVKKISQIDKMATDGTFDNMAKRERLQIMRQRAKLEKNFGSVADMTRLPAALFVVDVSKEYIAVREANRLNIPVFAIVDTNSDPNMVNFPIPANDDASKSIAHIIDIVAKAITEGLEERKAEKEKEAAAKEKKSPEKKDKEKTGQRKTRARKSRKKEDPVKSASPSEQLVKEGDEPGSDASSSESEKQKDKASEAAEKQPDKKPEESGSGESKTEEGK